jgi:RNA polymerase sigma factor (sigma-70 family)
VRLAPEQTSVLVRAAATGDPRAWEDLVDAYIGLVWSTVRKYRLNESDANDVVQTTWLRLVQNIDRIDDPSRVAGWLATTAGREALRVISQQRRVVLTDDATVFDGRDQQDAAPDAYLLSDERDCVVRELFEQLAPRCRELLTMVLADPPLGYDVIADRLNMPIGSIGPTRGRCLKKLAALAEARGVDLGQLRHV